MDTNTQVRAELFKVKALSHRLLPVNLRESSESCNDLGDYTCCSLGKKNMHMKIASRYCGNITFSLNENFIEIGKSYKLLECLRTTPNEY